MVLPTSRCARLTPGPAVIGSEVFDAGMIVTVPAPALIAWILPCTAKLPPSGMTLVIVGLACAAARIGNTAGGMAAQAMTAVTPAAAIIVRDLVMFRSI